MTHQYEGGITFCTPEFSEWQCYLFGNRPPGTSGIVWRPRKGGEPHAFARFMMRVCFDCLWVKDPPASRTSGATPK
jgi:hypothetical protein